MSGILKKFVGQSFVYGLSGIITRMITIFLVPLYTRLFEPADYGVMNLINTTFGLAGMFAILGLDSSASRFYYDDNNSDKRKEVFASWFWAQLSFSSVIAVLLFFASPIASKYLIQKDLGASLKIWVLPCITLIFNIIPSIIWNYFRLQLRAVSTVLFTLSQSLITIALTIYFVLFLKVGIIGVYYALFISGLVFSIIGFFIIKNWIDWKYFNFEKLKEMLKFSLPLIPASLSYWLMNSTDSYFILMFKDSAEVGLFAIGSSLASGVALLTGSMQQALGPFVFSIKDEPYAKQTYSNIFTMIGLGSALVILALFLFSPEVLKLLTSPQYFSADWVASILGINIILLSFLYIASIGTNIAKNNKPYATGVLIGAVFTIIFNFVFIPFLGKEGSAIATVLAQIIVVIYLFHKAQKLYFIPFRFSPVVVSITLAIVLGVFSKLFLYSDKAYMLLIYKLSIWLIFFLLIWIVWKRSKSTNIK